MEPAYSYQQTTEARETFRTAPDARHSHVEGVEFDGNMCTNESGVSTLRLTPTRFWWVKAPAGIEGVIPGEKLWVLSQFTSDAWCPLGAGHVCLEVEHGLIAVFAGAGRGVVWLRSKMAIAHTAAHNGFKKELAAFRALLEIPDQQP